MSKQSPIFVKTEVFLLWLLNHTHKFPKSERFRLAKRIEDAIFEFHGCLIEAATTQNTAAHLRQADVELNKLRTYLRLAVELQYSTSRQYGYATQHTTEIGKMLGGWQKTIKA